jgi:hypothetical protein
MRYSVTSRRTGSSSFGDRGQKWRTFCPATTLPVPTTVESWDIPDPANLPVEEVRPIRDAIEARVRELVDTRLDAIRTDRTAHQMRLVQMLPALAKEFEGRRSDGEIRACADAVLSDFDDVPVRSHVMTLAHRRTRECLAAERCAELVGLRWTAA